MPPPRGMMKTGSNRGQLSAADYVGDVMQLGSSGAPAQMLTADDRSFLDGLKQVFRENPMALSKVPGLVASLDRLNTLGGQASEQQQPAADPYSSWNVAGDVHLLEKDPMSQSSHDVTLTNNSGSIPLTMLLPTLNPQASPSTDMSIDVNLDPTLTLHNPLDFPKTADSINLQADGFSQKKMDILSLDLDHDNPESSVEEAVALDSNSLNETPTLEPLKNPQLAEQHLAPISSPEEFGGVTATSAFIPGGVDLSLLGSLPGLLSGSNIDIESQDSLHDLPSFQPHGIHHAHGTSSLGQSAPFIGQLPGGSVSSLHSVGNTHPLLSMENSNPMVNMGSRSDVVLPIVNSHISPVTTMLSDVSATPSFPPDPRDRSSSLSYRSTVSAHDNPVYLNLLEQQNNVVSSVPGLEDTHASQTR